MELISTDDFFILQHLQRSDTSLWVCRKTGKFSVRPPWDLSEQENPECLGLVWGLYGKLDIHPDVCQRLVLVRRCDRVGEIPGPRLRRHAVYRVGDVVLVPLVPPNLVPGDVPLSQQLGLKPCPKHHGGIVEHADFREAEAAASAGKESKFGLGGRILGGSLKLLSTDTFKSTAGNAAFFLPHVKAPWKPNVSKTVERFERRILEEITKMFTDSNSFYFSLTGDITNALQRQVARIPVTTTNTTTGQQIELFPTWRDVDDRFFFNRSMVEELIELGDQRLDAWITPFIQGYVEIRDCPLNLTESEQLFGYGDNLQLPDETTKLPDFYTIAVVSRRSRYRAGTRYKRRGLDDEGHVANYVETEQILVYHHYALSYLQVRGSVPVHWSQPGIRYRPPPRLDATPEQDKASFAKHFNGEYDTYGGPITCVNLVEKTGREKVVGDAYLDNALAFDRPDMNFVHFDFHEYCRGMHFENVSILTAALEEELIRAMRYCWLDKHGVVCQQQGVFRVNCIDCLDRTNVVQTAIARVVLVTQLTKLGLIPPEHGLPADLGTVFQGLWANNGDALSRQYAGTNALKGDFTRTGERNFSGLMKDGMNSASRYYLNQFRDAYRQATIDIITGQFVSESLMAGNLEAEEESTSTFYDGESVEEDHHATAEHVKSIIEDCKKLLIPDMNAIVGAWGLIDNDPVTGDPSQEDMDVIVILTKDSYYVAHYDDEVDKVTSYQRVVLADIEMIEFGVPDQATFNLSFRNQASKGNHSLRINYRMTPPPSAVLFDANGDQAETLPPDPASLYTGALSGYYHVFRATNLRFFNNMAIVVTTDEDRVECLKSVADSAIVAMELANLPPAPFLQGKLEKRRSRVPDVHSNFNEAPTNVATKAVSSGLKALTSVTNQFSKLNPISKFRQSKTKMEAASATALEDAVPQINVDDQTTYCDPNNPATLSNPPSMPTTMRPNSLGDAYQPFTPGQTTPTILLNQGSRGVLQSGPSPRGKKFTHMLSPLLSPSSGLGDSQAQYSSTSKLNLGGQSPKLNRRSRKVSKSSEDLRRLQGTNNPADEAVAGLRAAATNFLGVVELDASGDLKVRGGSLQKDLNIASQVLEDGAVETAAMIEKGVLNPFAKFTKGWGAVLGKQSPQQQPQQQQQQPVEVDEEVGIVPLTIVQEATPTGELLSPPRLMSQNNQVANALLKSRISEAKSQTQVILL